MTENKEEEKSVIGCLSVQLSVWTPNSVVEGSVIKQCDYCGLDVWLSPSGQKMRESQPCKLICLGCTIELKKECDKSGEEIKCDVVPGADVELNKHFKDFMENNEEKGKE